MEIREARIGDAEAIADFNARMAMETEKIELAPEVVLAGVKAVFDDASRGRFFVAEMEGKVVGQLLITHEWSDWRNGDIWWIQSVYVHADFRRHGVFRELYAYVREEARTAGARGLRLYVEMDNQRAQKTYESLGMGLTHYLVMEEMI